MDEADTQLVQEQVRLSIQGLHANSSSSSDAEDTQFAQVIDSGRRRHLARLNSRHSPHSSRTEAAASHEGQNDDSSVIPDSEPGHPPSDALLPQPKAHAPQNVYSTSTPRAGGLCPQQELHPFPPTMAVQARPSSPLTDQSASPSEDTKLQSLASTSLVDTEKRQAPQSAAISEDSQQPEKQRRKARSTIDSQNTSRQSTRKEKQRAGEAEPGDGRPAVPAAAREQPQVRRRRASNRPGQKTLVSATSSDDSDGANSTKSPRRNGVKRRLAPQVEVSIDAPAKRAKVGSSSKGAEALEASTSKPRQETLSSVAPDGAQVDQTPAQGDQSINPNDSDDEGTAPTQPSSQDERDLCGQLRHPRVPGLPIHRVFAYHAGAKAYFPAEIISLARDRAHCLFDDGEEVWPFYKDLRVCQLRDGDPVLYAGMDDSQGNNVTLTLHRAYRVEWADQSGRVVPDEVELGPSMIVAAREVSDRQTKNRFQVRAIKIPATKSNTVLQDRKLSAPVLAALKSQAVAADPEGVLFGARPSSKDRSNSHTKSRRSASISWAAVSPEKKAPASARGRSKRPAPSNSSSSSSLLRGFGFMLTGYVKEEDQSPSTSTNTNDPLNPLQAKAFTTEGAVKELIEAHGGTVFNEVSDILDVRVNAKTGAPTTHFSPLASSMSQLCLLANEPSRKSLKYLLALALGLPCVATGWLDQTIERGSVMPMGLALLGSGTSLKFRAPVLGLQRHLAQKEEFNLEALQRRQHLFQILKGKRFLHVSASNTKTAVSYPGLNSHADLIG